MNSPSRKATAESGAAPRRSEAGLVSSCTMRTPYAVRGRGAAPPTAVPTRFGHCDRIGSGQTGGVTPSTPSAVLALGGAYGETCDGSVPGDRAHHPYRLRQPGRKPQPDWRGAGRGLCAAHPPAWAFGTPHAPPGEGPGPARIGRPQLDPQTFFLHPGD